MTSTLSIDNLISTGESLTVEFKTSFDRETVETLVAFANAQGGTVLVGVADDGSIRGVSLGKETLNEWLSQIKSVTSPSIIQDIESHQVGTRSIVSIRISEYPVKPIHTRGRYYN